MAFAQRLFEQHGGVVHTYFKRLTGDATAAEDLTQEVFLRVVRSGDAYEHRDRERAWVFRIARNVLIDLRRQALRTPAADSRLEPTTAPRQNTRATLREALGLLPSEEREAFLGMVITPAFRNVEDLCAGGIEVGVGSADLDQGAAAWHVEGRLVELRQGEATIDLRWTRRINRPDLRPTGAATWQQRLVLRQGDVGVLDVVRTAKPPSPGCGSFSLTYELEFEGPRALAGAAVAYDLWLVQKDGDGELVTDRYQVTAKQGQKVDYFFRPVPYAGDGRRADGHSADIFMNVSGTIRGRVRTDGKIDLTVDGSRWSQMR